jgi:trehalose 2-sulfotransferase
MLGSQAAAQSAASRTAMSTKPRRSYLVCATPRSGSTLLCEGLESTGVAGRPREYFEALKETGLPRRPREYFWGLRSPEVARLLPHDARLEAQVEQAPAWSRDDYARHLNACLEEGTTPNGVFGAKLMWSYFGDFMELMRGIPRFAAMGDGSLLATAFPGLRYVFVSRNDKVRQAVSLWKALQTWVWRRDYGDDQAESTAGPPLVYSFDAIDHLLHQLRRHEDAWRGYFFRIGQTPLTLMYEEIAGDLEGSVRRVLEDVEVELQDGVTLKRESLGRQSDELSESWVQNYLEDVSRR